MPGTGNCADRGQTGADPPNVCFSDRDIMRKTVSALQEYENYTEIAYNPGTDI